MLKFLGDQVMLKLLVHSMAFCKNNSENTPLTMTSSRGLYSILDFSNCRNEAHTLTIAVNPDEHLLSVCIFN